MEHWFVVSIAVDREAEIATASELPLRASFVLRGARITRPDPSVAATSAIAEG